MAQTVKVRCKNNDTTQQVKIGSTLSEIYKNSGISMQYGPVSAKVNNKVEGMHYRVYHNKDVEYMDLYSSSGSRAYTRSLLFVLCKAVHDLYPAGEVIIDIPVSNGYYCNLLIDRAVTLQDVEQLRVKMKSIIAASIPIRRYECTTEEAIKMFDNLGSHSKVKLLKTVGSLYTTYYEIDGYVDYYYGTMLTNTSQLYLFGLEKYYDGLLLRIPSPQNPVVLGEITQQDKMFEIFKEQHRWQKIIEISTVGEFNEAVSNGFATNIINVSGALQEKKISQIADKITARKGVKMILISGPSSSGKTTTCKRLCVQLLANGIKPISISLDNYFVDREKTPHTENGDYDYESLYALDIPLLNAQINSLFKGDEVELPKYDFNTGKSIKSGHKLRMNQDNILVVEGIHALNPELTQQIPDEQIYRVYASALTTILLDTHNYIPTTDNRLLRRIIRDYKYRGVGAQETIRRWSSVRAGENKWIFPYQENADTMFNSAMIYELSVIKTQADPLLELVPENCEEHSEAYRLLKFLKYFVTVPYKSLPPTSLLREFLGGSSFKY